MLGSKLIDPVLLFLFEGLLVVPGRQTRIADTLRDGQHVPQHPAPRCQIKDGFFLGTTLDKDDNIVVLGAGNLLGEVEQRTLRMPSGL